MAASDIELINRSLALLGIESITSLSDNSKQASVARVLFNDTRAAVFRGHPWNCLTKRASLPTDVTAPVYGFGKRFALPADYLRLLEVEDSNSVVYQLERGHILCDNDTMNIKYTALITDVTLYDTLLVDTLSARIAADLAQPLLQSTSAMEQMWQMYELKLREAKFVDAQEQAQDVIDADYWLDSRQGTYRPNINTPPR
jgi:hypothetical protein|tara:strand:- start:3181 stop:3780 length:600 start_codon:yes stop_codon:yes gene_type:complete